MRRLLRYFYFRQFLFSYFRLRALLPLKPASKMPLLTKRLMLIKPNLLPQLKKKLSLLLRLSMATTELKLNLREPLTLVLGVVVEVDVVVDVV